MRNKIVLPKDFVTDCYSDKKPTKELIKKHEELLKNERKRNLAK